MRSNKTLLLLVCVALLIIGLAYLILSTNLAYLPFKALNQKKISAIDTGDPYYNPNDKFWIIRGYVYNSSPTRIDLATKTSKMSFELTNKTDFAKLGDIKESAPKRTTISPQLFQSLYGKGTLIQVYYNTYSKKNYAIGIRVI